MKLIKLVVYTNIFVAICAAGLTWETFLIIGAAVNYWLVTFVFFSTIFTYNFQRHARLTNSDYIDDNSSDRLKWIFFHRKKLFVLMLVSLALTIISFLFFVNLRIIILMAFIGGASILYVSGIKTKGILRYLFTLRDIPFLKIIMIAFIWGLTTVGLPLIVSNKINFSGDLYLFIQRACFIFAITIPFDIRDMKYDSAKNLMTIPNYFGIKKAKIIAIVLLIIAELMVILNYNISLINLSDMVALTISFAIACTFILLSGKNKKELYFSGLVESTMLIQFLLLIILKQL